MTSFFVIYDFFYFDKVYIRGDEILFIRQMGLTHSLSYETYQLLKWYIMPGPLRPCYA